MIQDTFKTLCNAGREVFAKKKDTEALKARVEKLKSDGGIGYSEFQEIPPRSYSHTIAESDFYEEGSLYMSQYTDTVPPMFDVLAQDRKYILNVNGEEAEKQYVFFDGFLFGNMHFIFPDRPDTGESYIILFSPTGDTFEYFDIVVASAVLSDFAFSIFEKDSSGSREVVHQIDSKYINASYLMAKENPTGTGSFSLNRNPENEIGEYSFAEGYRTTASDYYTHAEGYRTTASGYASHSEGQSTTASEYASHSEGYITTASGRSSHAEGQSTTASGTQSHAEGYGTTASNYRAHAEGNDTTASGECSHAEGAYTTASGDNQHVQGKYNVLDQSGLSSVYADIIGNGTSNTNRKNIEATTWTGDKRLKGDVYVHCNDDSTGGTKLEIVTQAEKSSWNNKQNALTAGTGISIVGNVISCTFPNGDTEEY